MKKLFLFCILTCAILLGACSGASGNIDKAFKLVEQKGDPVEVFNLISAKPINYQSLSLEDVAKLGFCSTYVNVSSWGHVSEEIKERNKVLGEISEHLAERMKSFTPEEKEEYMQIVANLMKTVNPNKHY